MTMKPWTTSLIDEREFALLLDLAASGMTVDAWRKAGDEALPEIHQADRDRVLRAGLELLDVSDDRIADATFLKLYRAGGLRERRSLLAARRFAFNPWVLAASRAIVQPVLLASERPLPSRPPMVPITEWSTFIDANVDAGSSRWSRDQTRLNIGRALIALGVVGRTGDVLRVERADPAPEAVAWLLVEELRIAGSSEMSNRAAGSTSVAAQAFALTEPRVARAIRRGEDIGLLQQSYLAGMARILRVS